MSQFSKKIDDDQWKEIINDYARDNDIKYLMDIIGVRFKELRDDYNQKLKMIKVELQSDYKSIVGMEKKKIEEDYLKKLKMMQEYIDDEIYKLYNQMSKSQQNVGRGFSL